MAGAEVAVAAKVGGEIADPFLTKFKKEIGYAWNCKEHVEKLRSERDKLESMMDRVQQKLESAVQNGDTILKGVKEWVAKAHPHISTTDEFLRKEAIAKMTCFKFRMHVNPNTLRRYGKHAAERVASLEQHQKDGAAFEGEISIPTPAPGRLEITPRENFDGLRTRNSVLKKIIELVKYERTQITGIYGIGGVGKSTLATEVYATVKDLFALVVFVEVKQHVDAASIKAQVEIAAKRIKKGEKVLIILDNMWTELKLHEVDIPCGTDFPSCKILLTTRLKSVCTAMKAHTIYVESLPIEEAWVLFKRVVGERLETDAKLNEVAWKVVEGCGGLPLILQAVGNALKDKESFKEWEKALDYIEKHATSDIDEAIRSKFAHLKLSYDYLKSEEAKSIFLLCSMFPEDFQIPLESLAYYCVGLQILTDLNTLEDARDKVQGAVKILKSSCLLLDGKDEFSTKMHDVVREVALLITSKDDNKFLVKAGKNLVEWEPRIGSLESYTGISLMENDIRKLPAGYELNIPLLKIFLIQGNPRLSEISDELTQAVKESKVVDFESNNISSLPKSLTQLTSLCMLNLCENKSLCDVSILGELNNLEILILNGTGITEIPHEIGNLVKLRLLHAVRCRGLSHIAPGVLSKLRWLEELHIGYYPLMDGNYNSLVEIGKLSKLTFLNLYVPRVSLFPEGDYLKRLKRFSIQIGEKGKFTRIPGNRTFDLSTPFLDISLVRELIEVSDGISLGWIGNLDNVIPFMLCAGLGLKSIYIHRCANLLCLVDSRVLDEIQTFHPSETHKGVKHNRRFLSEVEELWLSNLSSLKVIWNTTDQYISPNNLVKVQIDNCHKLEKIFTVSIAQGLVNMQTLRIRWCDSLKEVISDGDGETSTGEIDTVLPTKNIVFPRLAEIDLLYMSNLTSFYPGHATIKYPSLVNVFISNCDNMKKWAYGTNDSPNLQFVMINYTKVHGATLNEALAKDIEVADNNYLLEKLNYQQRSGGRIDERLVKEREEGDIARFGGCTIS